jgi:hypothetical protein
MRQEKVSQIMFPCKSSTRKHCSKINGSRGLRKLQSKMEVYIPCQGECTQDSERKCMWSSERVDKVFSERVKLPFEEVSSEDKIWYHPTAQI